MVTANDTQFLELFDQLLTGKHEEIYNVENKKLEKGDEVDILNQNREKNLELRLNTRNVLFLKKVELAKQKILAGTFGECEECGEHISQKRLIARPTATHCISCQEEKEKSDFGRFGKRRDLNSKKFKEESNDDHIKKNLSFSRLRDINFESVLD